MINYFNHKLCLLLNFKEEWVIPQKSIYYYYGSFNEGLAALEMKGGIVYPICYQLQMCNILFYSIYFQFFQFFSKMSRTLNSSVSGKECN